MLLCLLNYSYLFHWKSSVPPMYLDLAEEIGCLGLLDGVSAELVKICLYTTKLYTAWARLLNNCKSSSLEAPSAWSPHHLSTTLPQGQALCACVPMPSPSLQDLGALLQLKGDLLLVLLLCWAQGWSVRRWPFGILTLPADSIRLKSGKGRGFKL